MPTWANTHKHRDRPIDIEAHKDIHAYTHKHMYTQAHADTYVYT